MFYRWYITLTVVTKQTKCALQQYKSEIRNILSHVIVLLKNVDEKQKFVKMHVEGSSNLAQHCEKKTPTLLIILYKIARLTLEICRSHKIDSI